MAARRGPSRSAQQTFTFPYLTGVVPRWIGWLALFVGVLGGWVGLFGPASSVTFLGFFVWMASMGVVLLRRREREELALAATV